MPECLASCWIEREKIAGVVCSKEKMTCGGQDPLQAVAVDEFAIPNHFAGLVVESTQGGVGPKNAVATTPAFGFCFDGIVVNAEKAASDDVEEICLRVEAGRHPVGRTVGPRLN